jgi:hypothetical protein
MYAGHSLFQLSWSSWAALVCTGCAHLYGDARCKEEANRSDNLVCSLRRGCPVDRSYRDGVCRSEALSAASAIRTLRGVLPPVHVCGYRLKSSLEKGKEKQG